MKDYYSLLELPPEATADDIKRAFRREIARYHPDKVHHLGQEFQALAAARAAELTEAYRVLMDPGLRETYDRERGTSGPSPAAAPAAEAPPQQSRAQQPQQQTYARPEPPPPPPPREPEPAPRPREPESQTRNDFVRRMAINRFRDAIERSLDGVTSMPARGFEASYLVKGKRSLFGKQTPERMLTIYLGSVTPDEVTEAGNQAIAERGGATALTLFALGDRLAAAGELSGAIAGLKRKVPSGVQLNVVPVDVRDWTALVPKDASANVRAVIAQLTAKD